MSAHSSIVGGSSADRIISCPGSYQAQLALPASSDRSSEYAEEGTAMHAVMDAIMRERQRLETEAPLWVANQDNMLDAADRRIGDHFHDRVLTQEHLDDMVYPALEALADLEAKYGGGFRILAVEARVKFPGIPGAFGTCDIIMGNDTYVLHVDWKFGSGVGVKAAYVDESGVKLNPQLMFYATAAKSTVPSFYRGRRHMVIAIIQPRGDEPLTETVITAKDMKWFREDLETAVALATNRDPARARGEHCRFAPCKVNCQLWTDPLLDLTALGVVPQQRTDVVSKAATPYGEYLARAKTLVDILAMFSKEVNEQLHAYLEDGGTVPGWRLKLKSKQRQWIDADTVAATLKAMGFEDDEIWQKKLQTFGKTDAVAKSLGTKVPDDLRVAPSTTETTVCTIDDPAPIVERQLAIEQFSAALKKLTEGK